MGCPSCGSSNVEQDVASGSSFCTNCGYVLEENTIVAEVTFGETSAGAAVLQGTFVAEGKRGTGIQGPNRRGQNMESREQTIENGRRRILSLATALHLPEHYQERALRFFNMAVANNFVKGRRTQNVVAVCLYVVCREEKSSHMLIDFSDLLQINVFALGSTFLKFAKLVSLRTAVIDPSIYISRFAALLDFGEHMRQITQDAARLVSRMDRDWIRTGRRPAGICGACLLIAARMNGFRRTQREIIQVAKVADVTLRKRLDEFKDTPSGHLTVRDFRNVWLEQEADPPAFKKGRMERQKRKRKRRGKRKGKGKGKARGTDGEGGEIDASGSEDESENEPEDVNDKQKSREDYNAMPPPPLPSLLTKLDDNAGEGPSSSISRMMNSGNTSVEIEGLNPNDADDREEDMYKLDLHGITMSDDKGMETDGEQDEELEREMTSIMNDSQLESVVVQLERSRTHQRDEASLSDLDDDPEVEGGLLNSEEIKIKTQVWYEFNKEYLAEQAAKRKREEEDRRNGLVKSKSRKKGKPSKSLLNVGINSATAAEAAKAMLAARKTSRKLNYDVLDHLFESDDSLMLLKSRTVTPEPSFSFMNKLGSVEGYEIVEEDENDIQLPIKPLSVVSPLGESSGSIPMTRRTDPETRRTISATKSLVETVEEDGDGDEEMEPEDMDDEERLLGEARRALGYTEEEAGDYLDDYNEDEE